MLKRIFAIGGGVAAGTLMTIGAVNVAALWGFGPDRELDRVSAAMRDAMRVVHANYVDAGAVPYAQLQRAALKGMVASLDPYSEYMESNAFRTLKEEIDSQFGGIGVQIEMLEERVYVVAPIAGTPGERAGILRGDELVSVDGKPVGKGSLADLISRLRGKPGSTVRLGFRRPPAKEPIELTITREVIHVESIKGAEVDDDGIGYVRITHFTEQTGREFAAAVQRMRAAGMRALVLDLRNNPGGLLDAASSVTEVFFNPGELIVYTQGRTPALRQELKARGKAPAYVVPMAVLINGGSASAAEIVAGALKDTNRATIVGEKSFGKGSVQTVIPLEDGNGMRLTTSHYFTPSGRMIHGKGIEPDVEVAMTPEEEKAVLMQQLRPDVSKPKDFRERFGVDPAEDRVLEKARELLRRQPSAGVSS